jgi:hypothetical protein
MSCRSGPSSRQFLSQAVLEKQNPDSLPAKLHFMKRERKIGAIHQGNKKELPAVLATL